MELTKYLNYTVLDFLNDDDFIQWVNQPSVTSNSFWSDFFTLYPGRRLDAQQAASIIKSYNKQDVFDNSGRQQQVWERIATTLNNGQEKKVKVFAMPLLLRIAAMLLIICSISTILWYYNSNVIVTTAFGEVKTVTLPDNSIVVLNGNSTLTFAHNWGNAAREIWIEGEGLFKIVHLNKDPRHIKKSESFIVHCKDVNIDVLGTTFNVNNRHGKTAVALITGKISLQYLDGSAAKIKALILKPGDYVRYSPKKELKMDRISKPEKLSAWATGHSFVFINPTLQDIAEELEDNYGYHVTLTEEIAARKIEGEINVPNLSELLETLSTTLHVDINQTDNNITITEN